MKTILDIPDEILVEILLYLTPGERIPLSKTCTRFNSLVFEDGKTLRYLDFPESEHSISDVKEYLDKEITRELIRGLNLSNEMIAGRFSDSCIAKAMNLVDLNLLQTEMDLTRLQALLNRLQHVRRLSIKWTNRRDRHAVFDHHDILRQRFRGLIYLSVDTRFYLLKALISLLKMCEELKELYIVGNRYMGDENSTLPEEFPLPRSVEVVDYTGIDAPKVKQRIGELLSNPKEWTDFRMELCDADTNYQFHMERNVQVCAELLDHGTAKCARYDPAQNHCNVGRVLIPTDLLGEVVAMRHRSPTTELCCLSMSGLFNGRCSLTIKDAKRLLKDFSFQLSSLHLHHTVEINCDVHLIASAFPYLTELYLAGIISDESAKVTRNFEERLMREGEESMNPASTFATLVQNTPRLRHLRLQAGFSDNKSKHWDLDALGLISGWKSLETLDLSIMSFGDGSFLSQIAQQCKYLKTIRFDNQNSDRTLHPFYEERFLEMLSYCVNLRNLSLRCYNLSKPSQMFSLLRNNPLIETLELGFIGWQDSPENLTCSIEQLLDQCSRLTRFIIEFEDDVEELEEAFQRLDDEQLNLEIFVNVCYLYLLRGQTSDDAYLLRIRY